MKKIVFIFFVFFIFGCSTHKVNNSLYNCQKKHDTRTAMALNYYRKQLHWLSKFEYDKKSDTIYTLEINGVQGEVMFTFWNKRDTLSYAYESDFLPNNKSLFTKYMMKLVSEWNISEIRKEEEINGGILPNDMIYACRIIFNGKKHKIDCIYFNDFFDGKRDGTDFND